MKEILLVLGMHRSGTSLLARATSVFGAGLGDRLMPAATDNPKGFFEDLDVNALNEALLARLNLRWDMPMLIRPDELEGDEFRRLRAEAAGLLKRKAAPYRIFALKDPRMSLLLPFWMRVIDGLGWPCRCLIALRNPLDVADSLVRRNDMGTAAALQLWLTYNLQILGNLAGRPIPRVVVEYNAMLDDPAEELRRIGSALGLPEADAGELAAFSTSFVDAELSHGRASGAELSAHRDATPELLEVYGLLSDLATGGWNDAAVAGLLERCPLERIERSNFRVALAAARRMQERLEAEKVQALPVQAKGYEAEMARQAEDHAAAHVTRLQSELTGLLQDRDEARQWAAALQRELELAQADNARLRAGQQEIEAAVARLVQESAGLAETSNHSSALLENASRTITEIEGSLSFKVARALTLPLRLVGR